MPWRVDDLAWCRLQKNIRHFIRGFTVVAKFAVECATVIFRALKTARVFCCCNVDSAAAACWMCIIPGCTLGINSSFGVREDVLWDLSVTLVWLIPTPKLVCSRR